MEKRDFERIHIYLSSRFPCGNTFCSGTVTNLSEKGNRKPVESKKIEQVGQHKKYGFACCLAISILVPLISSAVYYALGLYGGVDSIIEKIILGALFLLTYLATRVAEES